MRLTVERELLKDALAFVGKYAGSEKFVPIMGHVLLKADGDGLTLTTTDADRAARDFVAASVQEPGEICLPADLFAKIIKSGAGHDVSIATDGSRTKITIGKSRFTLPSLPSADFPPAPLLDNKGVGEMVLPGGLIERVAREVGYAQSTEQTRYYLCGVYWCFAFNELQFCATDGKRLSLLGVEAPIGASNLPGSIVPSFAIPAWADPVSVVFSEAFFRFSNGKQAVATSLVEGTFPDYQRLIPKNQQSFTFDRQEFLSAAKRAALAAENNENSIMMIGRGETLTLLCPTPRAEVSEDIRYQGGDFQTAITSQNLIAALESYDCENIELRWTDHRSPVVIVNPLDTSRTAITMPFGDRRLAQYIGEAVAA